MCTSEQQPVDPYDGDTQSHIQIFDSVSRGSHTSIRGHKNSKLRLTEFFAEFDFIYLTRLAKKWQQQQISLRKFVIQISDNFHFFPESKKKKLHKYLLCFCSCFGFAPSKLIKMSDEKVSQETRQQLALNFFLIFGFSGLIQFLFLFNLIKQTNKTKHPRVTLLIDRSRHPLKMRKNFFPRPFVVKRLNKTSKKRELN